MVFSALVFLHNILHIHIRFTLVVASVAFADMNDCLTKCHWHAVECLITIFLLLIAYWLFFNVFAEFVKVCYIPTLCPYQTHDIQLFIWVSRI